MFKCFGCGKGGNLVNFVMEHEKLTYPEAIRKIARDHHIPIQERQLTEDEKRVENTRENLMVVNDIAAKCFASALEITEKAKVYMLNRGFQESTIKDFGIGFAPDDWHTIHHGLMQGFAIKEDAILAAGLISENKEGKRYDFFRNRIIFPIHNKYGRVISFNGRLLEATKEESKYINIRETELYSKSKTLYGIHLAFKAIRSLSHAYLVEGNTDVMRMHDIEVDNTVGTCGTAFTEDQAIELRRHCERLTIVFDADFNKSGENATIKAGKLALNKGFNVSVIRLPEPGDKSEKNDPDSHFTTREIFDTYKNKNEKPFIIWYSELFIKKHGASPEGRTKFTEEMGSIIASLPNPMSQEFYIQEIAKNHKIKERHLKSVVDKLLNVVNTTEKEQKFSYIPESVTLIDYEKYGFYEDNNCYYFRGKGGAPYKGSNFIIKPLFHVKSVQNAKRLFEIINEFGYSQIIELLQKDLVSLSTFRVRVESLGNYVWMAPESDLYRLKSFLYERTQTCIEITQLGWQSRPGFYAWANGIFDGKFFPVNEMGIVIHKDTNFYIPAYSNIYKHEHNLYVAERKFIHIEGSVTVEDYLKQLVFVFGNNALIGFSFFIATLFRDFIVSKFHFFPILNLFGPKGTGKTLMAKSLLKLFGNIPGGPNINSTSKAALADHISQFSNALCHIDEYKNNLDFEKVEFLKGIWDGVGRTRMNMDKDKKKETTAVDIGLILTGQEMPTADIALFSRLIYLTFNQVEHSEEEKEELKKLEEFESKGLTHITEFILMHRNYFMNNFDEAFMKISEDLTKLLNGKIIEDRIFNNWCIAGAAYSTLKDKINSPFDYSVVLSVYHSLLVKQNAETKRGNEISLFWDIVEYLLKDGLIEEGVDFKFHYTSELKSDLVDTNWSQPKNLIYVNHSRIIPLYRKHGYQMKENILPQKTLEHYLKNDKRYLGTKAGVRFKSTVIADNIESSGGTVKSYVTTAMVFDYNLLEINLNKTDGDFNEDITPNPIF
jgi:DNA primase catalytic core